MSRESKGQRRMNEVVGDGYGSTGLICLPASFQQIASRVSRMGSWRYDVG